MGEARCATTRGRRSWFEAVEQLGDLGTKSSEFATVQDRELFELRPSRLGEFDERASPIVGVDVPYEQTVLDRTADQLASRMESHLERFGDVGGRWRLPGGFGTTDHQEELVLGRCESVLTRGLLGERHEPTQPPPEVGE
jgi:hypothetical protein